MSTSNIFRIALICVQTVKYISIRTLKRQGLKKLVPVGHLHRLLRQALVRDLSKLVLHQKLEGRVTDLARGALATRSWSIRIMHWGTTAWVNVTLWKVKHIIWTYFATQCPTIDIAWYSYRCRCLKKTNLSRPPDTKSKHLQRPKPQCSFFLRVSRFGRPREGRSTSV